MYQGKFASNKGDQQAAINADLIAARKNAKEIAEAKQKMAQARRAQAARQPATPQAAKAAAPAARPNVPASRPAAQPARSASQKPSAPAAQTAARQPVRKNTPEATPQKKGPRLGGVIFYTLYFLFIGIFCLTVFFGLNWLNGWLADYEAAQPTTKSEEVFHQLFDNPDWKDLYQKAGVQDTPYEGVNEYVTYMQKKVGDEALTFAETSAGLTGDKKYIVKLGSEKVASFTLKGESKYITDIPDWQLGDIELFFDRADGYLIQKLNGHTASVNGVALDDSFTIQIATTKAEEYLPVGTSGIRTDIQKIDNLMAKPEVTITNAQGEQMEVVYDEATGTFVEQTSANTIGQDEENVALEATRIYGQFMVKRANRGDVAKYFDPSHEPYNLIVKSELFSTTNNGCRFNDESVSEYSRYSDDIFSVKVKATMAVIRTDGTTKDYPIEHTLFFTRKDANSKWMVFDMTNEDIQQPVGKVRLTFKNGDTILTSDFFNTDSRTVQTPTLTAPEGKILSGWAHTVVDESGRNTLVVEFEATEDGVVAIPVGKTLEPMVLNAYFEDASSAGSAAASTDSVADEASSEDAPSEEG